MKARFVSFEGVEGCGKGTQMALLADALVTRGLFVNRTREPGGTRVGERARDILLDPDSDPRPLTELFLLEAARAQVVSEVIEPALARGEWVLCDRFADSSVAYQSAARGLPLELVATVNRFACGDVIPDRTILLEMPVEQALLRARGRSSTTAANRRFEDEDLTFHRAVAAGYAALAARQPGRVRRVDGRGTPEQVHLRVLAALEGLLP